jgi:hypothetical protein
LSRAPPLIFLRTGSAGSRARHASRLATPADSSGRLTDEVATGDLEGTPDMGIIGSSGLGRKSETRKNVQKIFLHIQTHNCAVSTQGQLSKLNQAIANFCAANPWNTSANWNHEIFTRILNPVKRIHWMQSEKWLETVD